MRGIVTLGPGKTAFLPSGQGPFKNLWSTRLEGGGYSHRRGVAVDHGNRAWKGFGRTLLTKNQTRVCGARLRITLHSSRKKLFFASVSCRRRAGSSPSKDGSLHSKRESEKNNGGGGGRVYILSSSSKVIGKQLLLAQDNRGGVDVLCIKRRGCARGDSRLIQSGGLGGVGSAFGLNVRPKK